MSTTPDCGPAIIDFLFSQMQIDSEWSVREERGFTWWPHQLCQRVWAGPMRDDDGFGLVQVNAQTDLLVDVEPNAKSYLLLGALNTGVALNALVLDPLTRTVSMRAKVNAHQENQFWVQWLMAATVALQAAQAEMLISKGMQELLGGRPALSSHPLSGARPSPDGMLTVDREFITRGSQPIAFAPDEFELVKNIDPNPSVWTNIGVNGATAEFPYAGRHPLIPNAVMTSMYTAKGEVPHHRYGYGCFIRLNLPGTVLKASAEIANRLNLLESSPAGLQHLLGSWTRGRLGLEHTVFIPALSYRRGLCATFLHCMANRSRWTLSLDSQGHPRQ